MNGPPGPARPPGPPGQPPPAQRPPPGTPVESSAQDVGRMITVGQRRVAAQEERTAAALAHGTGVLTSVIGPAVVYGMYKERSDFVRYHAYQAMVWQAAVLVGGIVITVITCGAGSFVFVLGALMAGYVTLRAWEGSWDAYPLMSDLGRLR